MNRFALSAGAAAIAVSGALGAVFMGSAEEQVVAQDVLPAAPERLDSSTLAQYPDSAQTVKDILSSEALKGKYVVVELVAGWCPHCARLKPEMDTAFGNLKTAGENIARLTIVYQEGDHTTGARGAYAYRRTFGEMTQTRGFPEVHIYKDGALIGGFSGAHPAADIEAYLKRLMHPQPAPAPQTNPG